MKKLFEIWNTYLKEDEQQSLPIDMSPARTPKEVAELKFKAFFEKHATDLKQEFERKDSINGSEASGTFGDMDKIFDNYFLKSGFGSNPDYHKDEAYREMSEAIDYEINDFYSYMEQGKTTFDEGLKFLFMRLLEAHDELKWDKTSEIPIKY